MFANCILFATFCSIGTLVRRKKTWRYSALKVMEFGKLMADIRVYVSCKFEMYIFEIAQVIGENVPIAFLYILSIYIWSFKLICIHISSRKHKTFLQLINRCFTGSVLILTLSETVEVQKHVYCKML